MYMYRDYKFKNAYANVHHFCKCAYHILYMYINKSSLPSLEGTLLSCLYRRRMNASVDESVTLYEAQHNIVVSLSIIYMHLNYICTVPVCIENKDASNFVHGALLLEQVNHQNSRSDEQHSTTKVKSLSAIINVRNTHPRD